MRLDTVTITGADDATDPAALAALSDEFPYVEWGILFGSGIRPRFPSTGWLFRLQALNEQRATPLALSAHLCGQWVEAATHGAILMGGSPSFQRVQFNFHGRNLRQARELAAAVLAEQQHTPREWIYQIDGVNWSAYAEAAAAVGRCATPLFDRSGGAGVVPEAWPEPVHHALRCGYAGGLGPENLEAELGRIAKIAGAARIWIDMETRVRTDDDEQLDLGKVRSVLELVKGQVAA